MFLKYSGYSDVAVGIYALVATIASSGLVLFSGFLGDLYSKKKTLIIVSVLPAFSFLIFLVSKNFYVLFASAVFGLSFSAIGGGAGGGPVAPVMNALVADKVKAETRTRTYSNLMIISIISATLGGLFSSEIESTYPDSFYPILFLIALVLTLLSILFTLMIEDTAVKKREKQDFMPSKSSRNIGMIGFSGLMGSLGLGVVTPLMSIYFETIKFTVPEISLIFTLSYMAAIVAVFFASAFERLIGQVNSIVVFRAGGSALLILIPFVAPLLAASVYIIRTGLYQMALPIRQNFQMTILDPSERARGNSITGIARRIPYGISTTFGSYLLAMSAYVAMFSFAGVVSLFDPILYYFFFRNLKKEIKSDEISIQDNLIEPDKER
ncbi:MAG: MFS transporter [Candidatus Thermoplasmatota archaeon]|nr:MFS transporter [Candidatus Thermoplasmatota archaeon]